MGRIFKMSHVTVFNHLKKMTDLPAFKTTVLPAQTDDVLEVDEIFTFIAVKVFHIRIWIVQCPSGHGKSLRSLSVMEVWKVARRCGENFPTIINGVLS